MIEIAGRAMFIAVGSIMVGRTPKRWADRYRWYYEYAGTKIPTVLVIFQCLVGVFSILFGIFAP